MTPEQTKQIAQDVFDEWLSKGSMVGRQEIKIRNNDLMIDAYEKEKETSDLLKFTQASYIEQLESKLKIAIDALKFYESAMDTVESEKDEQNLPIGTILVCYAVYCEARNKAREALKEIL